MGVDECYARYIFLSFSISPISKAKHALRGVVGVGDLGDGEGEHTNSDVVGVGEVEEDHAGAKFRRRLVGSLIFLREAWSIGAATVALNLQS